MTFLRDRWFRLSCSVVCCRSLHSPNLVQISSSNKSFPLSTISSRSNCHWTCLRWRIMNKLEVQQVHRCSNRTFTCSGTTVVQVWCFLKRCCEVVCSISCSLWTFKAFHDGRIGELDWVITFHRRYCDQACLLVCSFVHLFAMLTMLCYARIWFAPNLAQIFSMCAKLLCLLFRGQSHSLRSNCFTDNLPLLIAQPWFRVSYYLHQVW